MKPLSNFTLRTITGAAFVAAILASMLSFWSFWAVMSLLLVLTLFEFRKLIDREKRNSAQNIAYFAFAHLYITLPFVCLAYIYSMNPLYALALFIFIWTNDTFAYLTGITIGKHKLWERISPKKTWEGFFGGLVFTIFAGIAFHHFTVDFFETHSLIKWIGLAIIVVVSGTFGDLFESAFKRKLNVKDSGTILPGHGGFLDRLDSILFAAPAVMVYLLLVN